MLKSASILFFSIFLMSTCQTVHKDALIIATSANMQYAMKDLIHAFTQETGVLCEPVISSSGKLSAQISEGAPYDVFVSADMKYPSELYKNGLTTQKPEIYAYGKLVLWSLNENIEPSIEILTDAMVNHIALANPRTAPFGIAAVEVLKYYNIYDTLDKKLVYGESISQTNQFIISGAAEIGFTAKSVVLSPEMKGKGKWAEVEVQIYSPIAQGIVILKNKQNHIENAVKFYDFLFSGQANEILTEYGYTTSDNE